MAHAPETREQRNPTWPGALRRTLAAAAMLALVAFGSARTAAANAITTENALTGAPSSQWDVSGAGDLTIQGFATDISVNKGETVRFKINTNASAYTIQIYRLGYYQGNGARLVGTGVVTATLPQGQPSPLYDASTGLTDCGNWAESAHWDVPATAVSGLYIARLRRTDTGGASHIAFVVRDDASTSDLIYQTADATWQAYNVYGGNSLYVGSTSYPGGHATKVSYNRPFLTRSGGGGSGQAGQDWLFNAEYPFIRWMEANGYDVSYSTDVDSDRRGALIQQHKAFLSVGHDEYWSGAQRANVEAARDAGVHLAFFCGNEIYWKTRWENSTDGTNTPYRTLVCYKEGTLGENVCGGKCDPLPNTWTGLWRDGCAYPSADGCRPENALSGNISWFDSEVSLVVGSAYKSLRFWRNTPVASLANGASVTMTAGTLGYEWDQDQYNAYYPAGRIQLSTTSNGGATHHLSLYRAPSGALVFGAGTVQWSWGLDSHHDRGSAAPTTAMQQATVNLFADMGVQPGSLQSGLVAATKSTDVTAPTSTIASPANGASITPGSAVTISGTASDAGGTLVGVEVSVDNGATWQLASGTTSWTYSWTPSSTGTVVIKSRGYDDSGNMQTAGAPPAANAISVTVSAFNCPCTAFTGTETPALPAVSDNTPLETGVKFLATVDGYITGLRFYKGAANTGTHLGHLWTTSGTMLAEATYTGETASGWQQVTLSTPVHVVPNTVYVASVHSTGYYADTNPYFSSAVTRGPLRLLADGENGGNGVYNYGGTTSTFPSSSWQASNYWVDVVFNTSVAADTTGPVVADRSPAANAAGVAINTAVTTTFNEALAPATVTTSTVLLRDPLLLTIAATVTYDAVAQTVTLTPTAPLAYATTYTATLKGGAASPRITDLAGNALAADVSWSFTTTAAPPPGPNEGPGGPILVLSSSANAFSRYPVEILRNEGFGEFAAKDIANVTADTLAAFDVVVLGDVTLTPAQVTLLTSWVNAGGTLVALRPNKQLAGLLGLTDAGSTLANKYLKVNTAAGAGVGITGEVIQFHGTADLYSLNGATAVASLYSTSTTATSYPAVTQRVVGSNGGQAIAFTFDLARSVVYTRQGNPAWNGQERDGTAPIRSDDLFYGAASTDPQADWVDLSKVAIPQADEQMRLFANLVTLGNQHRKPLPRFWYFPKGLKAVIVMTGDDHGDAGMQPRFDIYRQQSPANCSEPDWECVRATGYEYVGSTFTNAQAVFYNSLGFEVALHVNTNCADWTPSTIDGFYSSQLAQFTSAFPGIPVPTTNRTHCIANSDWSTQQDVEVSHGLRLDTNYYFWPPNWVNDSPGLFTGSGMPMRFARLDGSIIDCYQVTTQMTDESGQTYSMTADSLIARAIGPRGYYGAFCANMHFDNPNHPGSNAIVTSALANGVPVVSAKELLTWLDGRNGSSFRNITWNSGTLGFTVAVATGARNLRGMLPMQASTGRLSALTFNGAALAYTVQTIKGIDYAMFVASPGTYAASYVADTTPPTITAVNAATATQGRETITWTTNELSTTRVDYGTSAASLTLNATNPTPVTAHSITLTGLTAGATYYYRVTSADASNNSATSPASPASPLTFVAPVNHAPVAAVTATPTSGSTPLSVSYSAAGSADSDSDSLTFAWTFGDGGTATGRLASHTYTTAGTFSTVVTVTDGRGGSSTASVAITVSAATFPQNAVLDNFNRTTLGSNWIDQTSKFSLTSNTLAPKTGENYIEWTTSFGASQEAYFTISTASASAAEVNLMLKTQGTTWSAGHLEVSYDPAHSSVSVYTFTAPSTWATLATFTGVTFASGNQFGARALANGTVQVFKNGTLVGTTSATGWAFAASGGRIGISTFNASTARFDNFGGGNVTGVTAQAAPAQQIAGRVALPTELALSLPYPNPSANGVSIALALPREQAVGVSVYDVNGRAVWQQPAQTFAAGRWTLAWDGHVAGAPAPAGVYFVRVNAGPQTFFRRVAIVR